MHCITTLVTSHFTSRTVVVGLATYNDTEREYIGGLVHAALRVCFRTAPHPVAHLFTDDVAVRRNICSVLNIGELHLLNNYSVMAALPLYQDIVRLDICNASAIAPGGPYEQMRFGLPVWTMF